MDSVARVLVACSVGVAACGGGAREPPADRGLAAPDAVHALPSLLAEASGVTVLDATLLGIVADEYGMLFVVDAASGAIAGTRRFAEDGDYEDVASAGARVFVLRSDAVLIDIDDWRSSPLRVTRHTLPVDPACDAEGLAYVASRQELLVACRGGRDRQRAIHAFSVTGGTLRATAEWHLALDSLASFSESRGRRLPAAAFQPSAIAVDPATSELYVLSAMARTVTLLDVRHGPRDIWRIPDGVVEQPEGLAFAADRRMWVCGEGVTRAAHVARWNAMPAAQAVHGTIFPGITPECGNGKSDPRDRRWRADPCGRLAHVARLDPRHH